MLELKRVIEIGKVICNFNFLEGKGSFQLRKLIMTQHISPQIQEPVSFLVNQVSVYINTISHLSPAPHLRLRDVDDCL